MRKLLCSILIVLNLGLVYAKEHKFSRDVSTWKEIAVPVQEADLSVWRYSANYSKDAWIVHTEAGKVKADLAEKHPHKTTAYQRFVIAEEPLSASGKTDTSRIEVEDGWLVGYNKGEFGAALYWFSKNGKKHYKISDHQVINFFKKDYVLYALECLSHLGLSVS